METSGEKEYREDIIMKYVIWGAGVRAEEYFEMLKNLNYKREIDIIAFVDNNQEKWGSEFGGTKVISPRELLTIDFDYIDIWSANFKKQIRHQITDELGIPSNKLKCVFDKYKQQIEEKYRESDDRDIKSFIQSMKISNELPMYGFSPKDRHEYTEVFFDDVSGLNYIFFENKKMFLAKSYSTYFVRNGKKYTNDLWGEQDPNSPHRYERDKIAVQKNDVVVDAGVCEGNFALHHIDDVKRIYLIECDPGWMEALKLTFAPYQDKVVFCDKFLSDSDTNTTITLNSLVNEQIDFIKMDIEGEEIAALQGANEVFERNQHIKCSICSYHRHGDEEKIKNILEGYGMKTETSKGYVLFIYDKEVIRNPELRRAVVRGIK